MRGCLNLLDDFYGKNNTSPDGDGECKDGTVKQPELLLFPDLACSLCHFSFISHPFFPRTLSKTIL